MSKTDDTPKLYGAKLENRVLADSELDAVTGAIIIYDYEGSALRSGTGHPAKVTVPDIKLGTDLWIRQ